MPTEYETKPCTFRGCRGTMTFSKRALPPGPRTVQQIGGWSSLRQLSRYGHPSERATRAAVEAVGRGGRQ